LSSTWRAAVDWHATTLNSELSLIFSILADGAGQSGEIRPDMAAVAWQSRSNAQTVRKAISSLVDAGFLDKTRPAVWQISDTILECQPRCICPGAKDAPGRAAAPRPTREVAAVACVSAPATDEGAAAISYQVVRCEMAWRRAFATEPAPGLLRAMVKQAAAAGPIDAIGAAFREYLSRVKDPMYLNLQKFSSTWGAYLKAAAVPGGKSDDAFRAVFGGGVVSSLPTGDEDL